jgi:acetyl-CoA synthetase
MGADSETAPSVARRAQSVGLPRGSCGLLWESARRALDGLPGGRGLNIAHEAVDRHAMGPRASNVAIRWLGRTGERQDVTYDELRRLTNRFANVLRRLGVRKGDVVATLIGRVPPLYTAALGTLKNGSVYTPLSASGRGGPRCQRLLGRRRFQTWRGRARGGGP